MKYKKYFKKYLYQAFLKAMKDYDQIYKLKPTKIIMIQIGLDMTLSENGIEFLKKEITQHCPEHH